MEEAVEPNIEGFICPICIPADGLIQWKSGRRRPLLKGHSSTLSRRGERAEDSDQAPLDFVGRLHDHVRMFSTDDLVMRMRGTAFRADYENAADTTNSSPEHVKPILVESTDGLQMRIPEDLLPVRQPRQYFVPFSRILQLHAALHTPCRMLYLVPMLIGR